MTEQLGISVFGVASQHQQELHIDRSLIFVNLFCALLAFSACLPQVLWSALSYYEKVNSHKIPTSFWILARGLS